MSTIYALLIGINDYPDGVGDLNGCVNDVNNLQTHLEHFFGKKQRGKKLDIQVLTDANASKEKIVNGILKHLGQAGPGDIALFFYSGHGSQETAPSFFSYDEGDGLLETIVCHDSRPNNLPTSTNLVGTDLCDKEMRYLFGEVSKKGPELISIFECCHSGDNVRDNVHEEEDSTAKATDPEDKGGPSRSWDQFYFGKRAPKTPPRNAQELQAFLPEVSMIQFAAARSDEVAKEGKGRGFARKFSGNQWKPDKKKYGGKFIHTLLYLLGKSNNQISYYDLIQRVQIYLKSKANQTPVLYAQNKAEGYLFSGFLGSKIVNEGVSGQIKFQLDAGGSKGKWILDLGAVHGLPTQDLDKAKILVKDEQGKDLGIVGLEEVYASSSLLDLGGGTTPKVRMKSGASKKLDYKKFYYGYFQGLTSSPTNFHLAGGIKIDPGGASKNPILNNVRWENNKADSTYSIRLKNNRYYLFRTSDSTEKPIIKPEDGKEAFLGYVEQIAHWEMLKELKNAGEEFKKKYGNLPLEFKVYKYHGKDSPRELLSAQSNGSIKGVQAGDYLLSPFKSQKAGGKVNYGEYDIDILNRLENTSIFVSTLILSLDFAVTSFRSGATSMYEISPGKSISLPMGVFFDQPAHLISWEKDYQPSILKVFASTRKLDFDLVPLLRKPLPPPQSDDLRSESKTMKVEDLNSLKEWTTQSLNLQLRNILVNPVDKASLANSSLSNTAVSTGLSTNISTTHPSTPQKVDDLTLIKGLGSRSMVILYNGGIKSFAALAASNEAEIKAIFKKEGKSPRGVKKWISQAKALKA